VVVATHFAMLGHMPPRFLVKAVLFISTSVSGAPLTSQDALLRTGSEPRADKAPQMQPPAQAHMPVSVELGPSGEMHVLSKSTRQGSAVAFSGGQVISAAALSADSIGATTLQHSTVSSQSRTTLSTGVKGGLAGIVAGILQVLSLMWIRTAMNYQYYYGGSFPDTMRSLWASGGFLRFYQGVGFALLQVPLARFGDTFAQSIVIELYGMPGKSVHGFAAGLVVATIGSFWRVCMVPLDTLKLTSQVHGGGAGKVFSRRLRESGMLELWSGAVAIFMISWVGGVPFWAVYNTVFEYWPAPQTGTMHLVRNAFAGILASVASDLASNWLRVLKVKRQAAEKGSIGAEGYFADAMDVIAKDGTIGLFFRGIGTKMMAGAVQGALFSVLWNHLIG